MKGTDGKPGKDGTKELMVLMVQLENLASSVLMVLGAITSRMSLRFT